MHSAARACASVEASAEANRTRPFTQVLRQRLCPPAESCASFRFYFHVVSKSFCRWAMPQLAVAGSAEHG